MTKTFLVKVFYLAVFSLMVATAFLVGCGGGNNPEGPAIPAGDLSSITDTASTTGSSAITGKVVMEDNTPVGGVSVSLYIQPPSSGELIDTGRKMTSLTSGEFTFNNIGTGTFILKVAETSNFSESSKLAIVKDTGVTDTGNLIIFAKVPDATVPTLNFKGVAKDPLSKGPLSIAKVSLDSGQSTVTNAAGRFELKHIASGTRKLTIIQPGTASFSVSFDVRGTTPPMADGIFYNHLFYPVDAAGTVDFETLGVDITVNPNLHHAGALFGTVQKFVLNDLGYPTSDQEPYSNYEFDLWVINLEVGIVRKSH